MPDGYDLLRGDRLRPWTLTEPDAADAAAAVAFLRRHDALDLAPMLGLDGAA